MEWVELFIYKWVLKLLLSQPTVFGIIFTFTVNSNATKQKIWSITVRLTRFGIFALRLLKKNKYNFLLRTAAKVLNQPVLSSV